MVAYMNAKSLAKTIVTGRTWFWSRSRQQYWMKGESSGAVQDVVEIRYDCDADTLLVLVDQHGSGACHTGERPPLHRPPHPAPGPPAAPAAPPPAASSWPPAPPPPAPYSAPCQQTTKQTPINSAQTSP